MNKYNQAETHQYRPALGLMNNEFSITEIMLIYLGDDLRRRHNISNKDNVYNENIPILDNIHIKLQWSFPFFS